MGRLIRLLVTGLAMLTLAKGSSADDNSPEAPTFYKDVLPILQASCQNCHRPQGQNLGGMVAPMSLMTYAEARPWVKAIKKSVETRSMPPWHAAPEFHGKFKNERTITEEQAKTIIRWADTGAAEGDPKAAPAAPTFASYDGWSIGQPDLIVKAPRYFVEDKLEDEYVTLVTEITKEMLPEARWIKSVEFKAGSAAVHHIIAIPLGGLAPGYEPNTFDKGMGSLLEPGTKVRFQMHYHKESGPGTGVWDESVAAIKFWEKGEKIDYVMNVEPLGNFMFRIPAGSPDYTVAANYAFKQDGTILAINPHMHLRGKAAKYTATYPDGREEVILDVPKYDFNWQHTYYFAEPLKVPKGTKIRTQYWWDNSAANPANPDPTVDVKWGEPTTDEMAFGWMRYIEGEPLGIVVGQPLTEAQKEVLAHSGFSRRRGGRNIEGVEGAF